MMRWIAFWFALWSAPAMALDPALDISQYAHTAWRISEGFSTDPIGSFAQTSDGYLWFGSGAGLSRFDGVRNRLWQPPPGVSLPDNRVRALLVSRDGTLWIGTAGGLASWNGRALRTYTEFTGKYVNALLQDREGTIWVAGFTPPTTGYLCAIRGTGTECNGEDGRFGTGVSCLSEDKAGTLWAAASTGLWRWKPGPPQRYPQPEQFSGLRCLSETASGAILATMENGMEEFVNGQFEPFPLPRVALGVRVLVLFEDRDGSLWIGTHDGGLLRAYGGRLDSFGHSDGLSADQVLNVFEDREGTIWVSTSDGLDRFRPLPAVAYSTPQGMTGASSVLADRDGSIWISTSTGLYRRRDGKVLSYRPRGDGSPAAASAVTQPHAASDVFILDLPEQRGASLFQDRSGRIWLGSKTGLGYIENDRFVSMNGVPAAFIDSLAEDKQGNVWVVHRTLGLLRISTDLKVQQMPAPNGHLDWWRMAVDPVDGGLWLGNVAGGLVHLVDGEVRASFSAADGLGKGAVNDVRVASDGTVWAATNDGLNRIKAGRIATLSAKNGLPCDGIIASLEDGEGSTWIDTGCGLVRIARADLDAWAAAVDRGKAARSVRVAVLDASDGVRSAVPPGSTTTPQLAIARDGRLWFVTANGVTSVDPRHHYANTLPPPVHVEQIVADRKTYDLSGRVDLPPLVRDLTIDYTALSLVAPEKIQFRYKLEGRDRDWEDAGNRRQAFYNDLPPGNYRFRVIASNNSGVWNDEGASLAFSIAPTLWQTNWFLALCAIAFVAFLWEMYQLRMRQLARAQAIENRQREMELELAHANRLATMGQLTASIAHEVNQPLSASILNAGSALRWLKTDPPDLGEIRQALDRIVRDGNRAADVVARIRSMVKKAPGVREDLVINTKITNVLTIANSEILKHGIVIRTELAPDLPLVKGDRVQIQQVLLNLILNAAEAMSTLPDGPRELVIRSGRDESGNVLVSVRDTGPGLSPEAMERIFHPFYTSKKEGLGLGLSICQSIIEAHGGKLWASANTPRGAVFQFTLPVA
jgi:signal transduction histidine kinase/ligand-binding sensor domain-containing protein